MKNLKTKALSITQLALAAVIASSLFTSQAEAFFGGGGKSDAVCKVATNDIGTIVGRGRSPSAAFEDAATKCFERRADLYQMKKGTSVDEETGLVMIDMCANIRCGS
jgi:hypothetical protein